MLHQEKEDKLQKWGMIIYTCKNTYKYLRKRFPAKRYPKLILAVVMWPYFSKDDGSIEVSILRCMRNQSMDLFPTKCVCIRDADTIFHKAMTYYTKYNKYRDEFATLIHEWELSFLNLWTESFSDSELEDYKKSPPDTRYITEPIVLGTSYGYETEWHLDIPFPTPFIEEASKNYNMKKFFEDTKLKYKGKGLYAGFVNIGRHRENITNLWEHCVTYLTERYFMMRPPGGERIISDYFCDKFNGSTIGKDEKLLLFAILRHAFDFTHILYIEYGISKKPIIRVKNDKNYPEVLLRQNLINTNYVSSALNTAYNENKKKYVGDFFREDFNTIRKGHNKFMDKITRDNFYKAIYDHISPQQGDTKVEYFLKRDEKPLNKSIYKVDTKIRKTRKSRG